MDGNDYAFCFAVWIAAAVLGIWTGAAVMGSHMRTGLIEKGLAKWEVNSKTGETTFRIIEKWERFQ